MDKNEFTLMLVDADNKTFAMNILASTGIVIISIIFFCKILITLKTNTKISAKYSNF